jgi:tRNA A-37 threonylcarbamoyl transferase component Bud32
MKRSSKREDEEEEEEDDDEPSPSSSSVRKKTKTGEDEMEKMKKKTLVKLYKNYRAKGGYQKQMKERSRERQLRTKVAPECKLSKGDRKFFKTFLPTVFENEILTKYNECEKISAYVLNKVLSGSRNDIEKSGGLKVRRKSDYIINKFMGRGSFGYVMNVVNEDDDMNYVLKLIAVKTGKVHKEYVYKPMTEEEEDEEKNVKTKFKPVNGEEVHKIEREIRMQYQLSELFKEEEEVVKIPRVYRMKDMSKSNNLYGVMMEKISLEDGSGYYTFPVSFAKPTSMSDDAWKHDTEWYLGMLLEGINELHSKGYTHGDVAYRNVMFYLSLDRKKKKVVFFDFGRTLNVREDIKNPYNQVLLKLFDYYSVLIEIFRSFEGMKTTRELEDFYFVSDCLSRIVKPYITDIFEGYDYKMFDSETELRLFIFHLVTLFSDMRTDEKKEELFKNKRWGRDNIFRGKVFYVEEEGGRKKGGEEKMTFFSFFP